MSFSLLVASDAVKIDFLMKAVWALEGAIGKTYDATVLRPKTVTATRIVFSLFDSSLRTLLDRI